MLHQRDYGEAEPAQLIGLTAVAAAVVRDLLSPLPAIELRFDRAVAGYSPSQSS